MLKSITASFDERMRLLLDPHYVSTSPATSSAASSTSSAASRKASVAAEDAAAVVAMGKKRERGDAAVDAAEADSLKERSASVGGSPRQKLSIKVGEQRFLNLIPNVHEL